MSGLEKPIPDAQPPNVVNGVVLPLKRKRRNGPFKRSRTGCGTCKKRGKKCDEQWSDEGFCQRCIAGEWECTGKSTPPTKRSDSAEDMSQDVSSSELVVEPPSVGAGSSSQESIPLRPPLPSHSSSTSTANQPTFPLPPPQPGSTDPPLPSQPLIPPPPAIPPVQPAPSLPTSIQSQTTVQNIQPAPFNSSNTWPFPAQLNTPAPSSFFQQTQSGQQIQQLFSSFPQALFDWPNNWNPNMAPSAHLTTFSDGSIAIDSTPFTWNGTLEGETTNIFDDFDHLFEPPLQTQTPHPPPHQLNGQSRVLFLNGNGKQPIRHGVSLAEIYARVVESWLVGLPSAARDYARARIMALNNDSGGVMRAVRYAVATAYIFLYASDPQTESEDGPQPKLVELAYKGAGVVNQHQRKNSPKDSASSPHSVETPGSANMVKKLRLYVDHVSTPFAADLESSKWTEDAIQELRTVVITDKSQLSDLLWGVIDLQLVEFIRGGAATSYNMLALGDRLITQCYGEAHPSLTLNELCTSETISLRLYALSDISRCIVHRGRRTIFNFWSNAATPTPPAADNNEEFTWSCYLGLPGDIAVLLAEVVNLTAELSHRSTTKIHAQAEELETAIRNWQPHHYPTANALDATAVVTRTIAGQMWRLCALILLYQSVHRVGSLHPVLRRAQSEMLALLDSIVRLPNGDLWGFLGLPSFLCASLSHTEADRQRAMQHMMRPGPEKMWLDNIALISRLWEEVDQTGRPVDWHDKMQREGMSVAFF